MVNSIQRSVVTVDEQTQPTKRVKHALIVALIVFVALPAVSIVWILHQTNCKRSALIRLQELGGGCRILRPTWATWFCSNIETYIEAGECGFDPRPPKHFLVDARYLRLFDTTNSVMFEDRTFTCEELRDLLAAVQQLRDLNRLELLWVGFVGPDCDKPLCEIKTLCAERGIDLRMVKQSSDDDADATK